jgi:hypothetical protein
MKYDMNFLHCARGVASRASVLDMTLFHDSIIVLLSLYSNGSVASILHAYHISLVATERQKSPLVGRQGRKNHSESACEQTRV